MNDGWTHAARMRNIEAIDAELRMLSRAWRVAREMGCTPNTVFIDTLLDERAATTTSAATVGRGGLDWAGHS